MDKVLFIYKNRNLAAQFVKHFKLNGYNVTEFYDEEIPYRQYNFFQRLENIFYRLFLNNIKQIHKIDDRNFRLHSNKKLNQLKAKKLQFDFCFVVRGDLIPENVLTYARTVSGKMIDYQLDGLSVSSRILDYKSLFDQIYVFDEQDVIDYPGYGLKATTNCYFEEKSEDEDIWDIYYTGALVENRLQAIENFYTELGDQYRYHINLGSSREFPTTAPVHFLKEPISYEDNLAYTISSKVLLDFKREEHDGLSLRFFEALAYDKKIVTNNTAVKKYDFYNPQNIFVTDFNNFEGLSQFLEMPYHPVEPKVRDQYNFKTWISKLLAGVG